MQQCIKVSLAGKELQFNNKIIDAAEYDNVFCYTLDLQLLWRIKPAPVAIGGTARSPYVGVDIVDGNCRTIDFMEEDLGLILKMKK